jgi:S-DNA-T family DNA segregation ATPase FtsK/SpoIIIE
MAKKNVKDDEEEIASSAIRRGGGKNKRNNKEKNKLKDETRHGILGIGFLVFGLFILLSVFNLAGMAGDFIYKLLGGLFGIGYYILPIILIITGVSFLRKGEASIAKRHISMGLVAIFSLLGVLDIFVNGAGESIDIALGGYLGSLVAWPFVKLFGIYAGVLLLLSILIISLIILFDQVPNFNEFINKIWSLLKRDIKLPIKNNTEEVAYPPVEEKKEEVVEETDGGIKGVTTGEYEEGDMEEKKLSLSAKKKFHTNYIAPPLSLLERDKGKPNVGDLKGNMNIIQRTLLNFGISVEMDEVTIGPTITRYALKPAQGVKLSRIVGLQNDLALALAAHPIRIEAPIPGKSLVGIEIPNKGKSTVGLATLLSDSAFQNSANPLTVALGKGLSGKAIFGNLAKMPHLLVAGTTGSGKSVTIHSMITSLLYRNGPDDMKMILVDPKRVELPLYNKIPHLLTPVITDAKKTILALKWAAQEMDRRYDILEAESVRDISSYHQNIYKTGKDKNDDEIERMPYIVIVIDELADIMQTYPRELESSIIRLAQMSRAVGIHLILSTQRPSVNVITGLIKANVPSRIALQVSSQIDSRTILDQGGAEKLLGAGDMLFASGEMAQPERLQSAFISEEEVKKVVEYLKKAYIDEIPETIELTGSIEKGGGGLFSDNMEDSGDDDLYEDARMTVIDAGKASTSYLQRKLGVGYARAAKLIDMLEERGVVGPGNGSKPRDVLENKVDNIGQEEV